MSAIRNLFSRRRRYEDLSVSIHEHIAERTDELMDDGMPRAEAEQAARREFGNVRLIEDRSREVWQWPTVESLLADVRYTLRQLIKSPGFTTTAVLTLALGIAVNATMFSLVSAFLLPHLPGRNPQEIVVVSSVNPDASFEPDTNAVSPPNYVEWRKHTQVFSEMAAEEDLTGSLSGFGEQPQATTYAAVSLNYFSLFGAAPQLGRGFAAGEDVAGRDHVVILSHGLWERRFGSDASVIGRTVRLNREDYVVAGVMPADFRLLGFTPQMWTPRTLSPIDLAPEARKSRSLTVFARLAPGVTLKQAQGEMNILAQQAQQDFPDTEKRWGISVRGLRDFLIYDFGIRPALTIIMTVVGFVLLIACANVAGLLLTRAVGRQKELAIRMSLGASRSRMVRQLVTEGLVIALLGGGVGLLLSYFGIGLVRAGLSFNEAISAIPVGLDVRVVVFAAGVAMLSALLSSIAPALKASRSAMNADLKNESRGGTAGRGQGRLRSLLVGVEIALAVVLLAGSALLIHSVYMVDHQKLGFARDHLITAGMALDHARYGDAAKQDQFVRELVSKLEQVPGVQAAAVTSSLPASGANRVPVLIEGRPETRSNEHLLTNDTVVTPEYFSVAGVPVLRGRSFTEADGAQAPRVAVVSQEFARKYFPREDAIGKKIQLDVDGGKGVWWQIVGVAADVKSFSEDTVWEPQVYEAFHQRPVGWVSLMARSTVDPATLAGPVRSVVSQMDPELPLLRLMSMDGVIDVQRNGNPLFEKLLATFAVLALILATIGLYGLIAYSVGQRTQEIGIRMALGAKTADISRMILREGLKVAAIGSAIGLALSLPLPKVFDSMFVGLSTSTPGIYPIVALAMLLVAMGATYVPARRATRVDPSKALRNE